MDNDCDAEVDEDLGQEYYVDQDNDGYGDSENIQRQDLQTGLSSSGDCDDQNLVFAPKKTTRDEIDNDCDGNIDNGVSNFYYVDTDEDTMGTLNHRLKVALLLQDMWITAMTAMILIHWYILIQ